MGSCDRIDELDPSLFEHIESIGSSVADRRSLLALHAALAARGNFRFLEVGSYLGASLQAFIVDPRCTRIVSIDRRDQVSPDERPIQPEYPGNTTGQMLDRLSEVQGADLEKLITIDSSTEELEPAGLTADLCFIDAEHTNAAVLRDARFCRRVIRDRGVIVFHKRAVVGLGIRQFLHELSRYRAYPLAHELFVVEINLPSLLSDPRVRMQVPRKAWFLVDRLRVVRPALQVGAMIQSLRTNLFRRRPPLHLVAYRRLRAGLPARRRPAHYLAVCAIFRDEALYLREWVAFHRLQGVEHFWLYDNLSRDDWRSAIEPHTDVVDVMPWPAEPGQNSAYLDCLKSHRHDARWISFLDVDEFLFSPTGRSLPDVLRDFERHPGVVVNWRMYGTNGYEERPDGLVIENYTRRGPDDHRDNRYVKSIVNPRRTVDFVDQPHSFYHCGVAVGEDHQPTERAFRNPPTAELLRINHYYAKSVADWERKRARPNATDGQIRQTALVPADEVRDEAILQFAAELRKADPSPTQN